MSRARFSVYPISILRTHEAGNGKDEIQVALAGPLHRATCFLEQRCTAGVLSTGDRRWVSAGAKTLLTQLIPILVLLDKGPNQLMTLMPHVIDFDTVPSPHDPNHSAIHIDDRL